MPKKENKIEMRNFPISYEIRSGSGRHIVGHAAVFNQWTDLGFIRERVLPGAFAETIQRDDIYALFNHSPDLILGRNKAGTLSLREDEKGLHVDIDPPETQYADDLLKLIKRGDVSGMSFGFEVAKDDFNHAKSERTIQEVILWDISPVTFPAYPQTDVYVRRGDRPKRGAGVLLDLLRRRLFLRTRQA